MSFDFLKKKLMLRLDTLGIRILKTSEEDKPTWMAYIPVVVPCHKLNKRIFPLVLQLAWYIPQQVVRASLNLSSNS
ncbi:hypothetical protein Bca4012_083291 [Brassica carinata]